MAKLNLIIACIASSTLATISPKAQASSLACLQLIKPSGIILRTENGGVPVEELLQTRGGVAVKRDRTLNDYDQTFSAPLSIRSYLVKGASQHINFKQLLSSLGPNEAWLNVGAGQARAEGEFATQPGYQGRAVAVDLINTPETTQKMVEESNGRLRFMGKKPLEDQFEEVRAALPPEGASLVTDYYGGGSYSRQMDNALEMQAHLTKVGGLIMWTLADTTVIHSHLQNETAILSAREAKLESLANEYFKPLYESKLRAFGEVAAQQAVESYLQMEKGILRQSSPVFTWFESMQGLEIVSIADSIWEPGFTIILRRTPGPIVIPKLHLDHYEFHGPPKREYSR